MDSSAKRMIAMFSSVPQNAIISIHDVSNIYRGPLMMMEQNMASMLVHRLRTREIHNMLLRIFTKNVSIATS